MVLKLTLQIVIGGAFGDEGKGKITSWLAKYAKIDAAVRAGVGPNAGHSVVYQDILYKLRLIPSGFVSDDAKIYISAGVLINIDILMKEIEVTGVRDRIFIDRHTGVITDEHIAREKGNKHLMDTVGSTGSGCGPTHVDRVNRSLKLAKDYPELLPYIVDVSKEVHELLENGKNVVIEGSQATFLSLYHGTYPYVTSKDVCASGALSDVGIGPTMVDEVILVLKAFMTRVGEGPFEDELEPEEVKKRGWEEYGTVTGRLRRAAPFNYEMAKTAVRINGASSIALTKMDILFPELKGANRLDQLTPEAREFIHKIEDATKVHVKYVSTGPEVDAMIIRE